MKIQEMKITQIASSVAKELGGPSEVAIAFSSDLVKLNADNRTIIFGPESFQLPASLHINTLFSNRFGIPSGIIKSTIRKTIQASDVLIIHGFYLYSTLYALFFSRTKDIFLMPHGSLESYQERQSGIRKYIFKKTLALVIRKKKIHFLVGSESEVSSIRKIFPKNKITAVGLGISSTMLNNYSGTKQTGSGNNLLCLSRIAPKKRIDLSIRTLYELRNLGFDYHLDIAGNGDSKLIQELKLLSHHLDVSDYITWHNFVEGNQKDELLKHAGIFLLPSENENFAIAVAESIASGIPVVVSKNVAMHSFVDIHKTGLTIHALEPKLIAEAVLTIRRSYSTYVSNCLKSAHLLEWKSVFTNWYSAIEKSVNL